MYIDALKDIEQSMMNYCPAIDLWADNCRANPHLDADFIIFYLSLIAIYMISKQIIYSDH